MDVRELCYEEGRWMQLSHTASCPVMGLDVCEVELSGSPARVLMRRHRTEDHFHITYKIVFIILFPSWREKIVYNHSTYEFIFSSTRYCDSVKGFFSHLLSRAQRVTADVYALMFLCDFFNFMVVIFGFASFGVS
jgi:hypothetical protein